MSAGSNGAVTVVEGNVVYCDFRGGAGPAPSAATTLEQTLGAIRGAIARMNGIVTETLAVHAEASALEKDGAELLLKALDSMDIVAFQSRILLSGVDDARAGDPAFIAATLERFVCAGVAVSQRLEKLAVEHRDWIGAETLALRELVAQAGRLEATASDCIQAMRAEAGDGRAP